MIIFLRAILVYLLATIPAMAAEPIMYFMSAGFALSFGWIAAVLFFFFFYLLQKLPAGLPIKTVLLYLSVAISVVIAFQAMELTGVEQHIWESGAFLLFPAVAIVSGWISLIIGKQKINYIMSFCREPENETNGADLLPSAENIF